MNIEEIRSPDPLPPSELIPPVEKVVKISDRQKEPPNSPLKKKEKKRKTPSPGKGDKVNIVV